MKNNYLPFLFRDSGSGGGGGMDLLGIGSAIQGVTGLAQTIGGWIQQGKATKKLEKLQSPTYAANKGILDYYNTALSRYGVSPTDSAMYKRQNRDIDRGVAQGINSLQDRRSGIAGVSSILRAANDAKLDANVAAEEQRNQRFGELGNATQLKAGEERTEFDINKQQPYERKYNLLAMKAGGGNQIMNSGLSNLSNLGSSMIQMNMLKNSYGGDSGGGSKQGGFYNTKIGKYYK